MHSLFVDTSPLICNKINLLSLGFVDHWPWGVNNQTFPEDRAWLQQLLMPANLFRVVLTWFTAWAPASQCRSFLFPTPFPLKSSGLPWTGKMVFETLAHYLPRLSASWIKQPSLLHDHLCLKYWFLSSQATKFKFRTSALVAQVNV